MKSSLDGIVLQEAADVAFEWAPRNVLSPIYDLPHSFGQDYFHIFLGVIRLIGNCSVKIVHFMGGSLQQMSLQEGTQPIIFYDAWPEIVIDLCIFDRLRGLESGGNSMPL